MTVMIKDIYFDLESLPIYYENGKLRLSHGQEIDFEEPKTICRFCSDNLDQDNENDMISGCCEDCRINGEGR